MKSHVWFALLLVAFVPAMLVSQEKKTPDKATPKPVDKTPDKLSPAESAKAFKVSKGLRFDQVLSEPAVRQPLAMTFDERGRLWVVNYLQYPHPAGIKLVSRDVFWRAVYDSVPKPPPNHVRGADEITIHEDTDGDGVFDKRSVFQDGLNIATAAVRGRGGVWVLNPPYLLFYPSKDGDRPSGDPVVHLEGFGLEDTHSCANSMRWGPDGWLYGAHGSTVTAKVLVRGTETKPVTMIGQHIWRYHPEKKRFEVFAEGGGNAFGVEIDAAGRVFSGHNGGDTRGFHYVQGGYYIKGFTKHGVLSNPYTFGYFQSMKHAKVQRFSHTFVIDQGGALPEPFRGNLFAVEPLQGRVMMSKMAADHGSVQTEDVEPVVVSNDPWFRPVDIKAAPDGSLFVADFYEKKIDHLSHHSVGLDRDTGRIYRLSAADAKPRKAEDLGKKTTAQLVALLASPNRWQRQMAIRLLGDRRDVSVEAHLKALLETTTSDLALEALWALNAIGRFDVAAAESLVRHPNPQVRAWTVRLLADDHRLGAVAGTVAQLASLEKDERVRSQYASSARRLPVGEALPIVAGLMTHDEDNDHLHIPLLLWWAIETHCEKDRAAVLELFRDSTLWQTEVAKKAVLPRLMKRWAMAGTQKDLLACAELLKLDTAKANTTALLGAIEEGFRGRSVAAIPKELLAEIDKRGGGRLPLALRLGGADAFALAEKTVLDKKSKADDRIELIGILGELHRPASAKVLLGLLADDEMADVRRAAVVALQSFDDAAIGAEVAKRYPKWTGELQGAGASLLASRKTWSFEALAAVEAGTIPAKSLPRETVRAMMLHKDKRIAELVTKHWGDVTRGATTAEMKADADRIIGSVAAGTGDPHSGKKLFVARCGACHVLHATGGTVGPDLTPFKRDDVAHLVLHIVNPSAEIREGFENQVIVTESGRTLSGVLVEKDARLIVLKTAEGQKVAVPVSDVAEMAVSGKSLMPENLLEGLGEQDVRDLFAYLRSSQPLYDRR